MIVSTSQNLRESTRYIEREIEMMKYSFKDMSYVYECECMNTDEDRNMNKIWSTVHHGFSWEPRTLVYYE